MVAKEDVKKAKAAAHTASRYADAAWFKYRKLKREYEDGIKSTKD